jgi:hypothetical protein
VIDGDEKEAVAARAIAALVGSKSGFTPPEAMRTLALAIAEVVCACSENEAEMLRHIDIVAHGAKAGVIAAGWITTQ